MRNEAKEIADCSIVIEDPVSGVTVDPPAFKLRGNEVRTVTVQFSETARPRSQRVLMKLRDTTGADVATFEHPLLFAGSTDCSITLSFKDVIIEGGDLKGFSLLCGLKSQSEGPAVFNVSLAAHPALTTGQIPAIALEPGEAGEATIAVRWDRSVKDGAGLNHPQLLEVGTAVSNGRRTARIRWESIEPKLQPSAWKNAYANVVKASTPLLLLTDSAIPANGVPQKEDKPSSQPVAAVQPQAPEELSLFTNQSAAPARADVSPTPPPAQPVAATNGSPPAGGPKLTPYTPARFDAMADAIVGSPRIIKPAQPLPEVSIAEPARMTATVIRTWPAAVSESKKRFPVGVVLGGIAAVGALALAGVLFKPNGSAISKSPAATRVAASSAAHVASQSVAPEQVKRVVVRVQAKKRVATTAAAQATAAAHPTPAATQAAATAAPQTPRPTMRPAAAAPVHRAPSWSAPAVRPAPPQAVSQSVVALGGIEAFYGPRGHAVRVFWSAAEQASASVQLIDDRGAVVSATNVRGGRQNALLYLPRRFRGALTVQVSSQGRLGERVAATTSLPPFGY